MAKHEKSDGKDEAKAAHPAGTENAEPAENGYSDVSAAVEQAQKDLAEPEHDSETGIAKVDTTAHAAVAAEQSRRAVGATEGGGPLPERVIRSRYLDPVRSLVGPQDYEDTDAK